MQTWLLINFQCNDNYDRDQATSNISFRIQDTLNVFFVVEKKSCPLVRVRSFVIMIFFFVVSKMRSIQYYCVLFGYQSNQTYIFSPIKTLRPQSLELRLIQFSTNAVHWIVQKTPFPIDPVWCVFYVPWYKFFVSFHPFFFSLSNQFSQCVM